MFNNALKTRTLLASSLILVTIGCSHNRRQDQDMSASARTASDSSYSSADSSSPAAGAQSYVSIDFAKGQTELSESEKEKLRSLTAQVPGNKVNEVVVLAWADKEYPAQGTKPARQDVKIADQRADNISKFLKSDLGYNVDVDDYNMAKRPNKFGEMMRTKDFAIKKNLEKSGELPVAGDESILTGSKASTALVLVTYDSY